MIKLIFFIFVFVSCGQDKKINKFKLLGVFEQFEAQEGIACQNSASLTHPIHLKIKNLNTKILKAAYPFKGKVNLEFTHLEKVKGDAKEPVVISELLLEEELDLIENTIGQSEVLSEIIEGKNLDKNLSDQELKTFQIIIGKINGVFQLAKRLQLKSCIVKKRQDDQKLELLRRYLVLKDQEDKTNAFVDFCQISGTCTGGEVLDWKDYTYKEKNNYLAMFSIQKRRNDVVCSKNDDGQIIFNVPFFETNKDKINLLKKVQKNFWSTPGYRLEFDFISEGNKSNFPHFASSTGGHAHVNGLAGNVITLGDSINVAKTVKVVAHELGHILGFSDCYIEYFYQNKLVYFEAKQNDLMCSLGSGSKITISHMKELEKAYCN